MAVQRSPIGHTIPAIGINEEDNPRDQPLASFSEQNSSGDQEPHSEKDQFTNYIREDFISAIRKPQLPPFIKNRPDIWFILIETQLNSCRINSDEVKFSAALRALDSKTLQKLTDIIYLPPDKENYSQLKKTVIQRLSDSRQKQIQTLLNELVSGDKKPSQLLREMRNLAARGITDDMLHTLWLNRLPSQLKPLLVDPNAVMSQLEKRIDDLKKVLTYCLTQMTQRMSRSRSDHSKSRHRSRSRTQEKRSICYYHQRFSSTAKKSTTPCSFTKTQTSEN
ncbi:uncharacterized protein [Prorops nasuta]|uniref:uncharacterized protein n=1 Tax=Prorops nasuta TaxID=863751 RepID=UPI0034CE100C